MRALLLAAGRGTRLRPLTDFLPKCLVPIHGRPLLDYWLENLLENGVEEIFVNTHYKAEMVEAYISRCTWRSHVNLIYESQLLGTAGTINRNRHKFGNAPFFVAHADNLCEFSFEAFREAHERRPAGVEVTMMVFETTTPESCGIVERDKNGLVQAFHEKVPSPPGRTANAAVYIMEPTVTDISHLADCPELDISIHLIPELIGRIATFENKIYHRDIGTIQSWRLAHSEFIGSPANMTNARAWQQTLEMTGQNFQRVISKLLSGNIA